MLSGLFSLVQDLGILDSLKYKLFPQPDPAAEKLAEILKELSKTYEAIDSELTNYLSIWFDDKDSKMIAEQRRNLIGLEGGSVKVRVAEARGHCSKIKSIYKRDLQRRFKKFLNKQEYESIECIFENLDSADFAFISSIDQLTFWLEDRANCILDLIGQMNYTAANNEIENDRRQVRDTRLSLSHAMKELYQPQAEFIILSSAL